MTDVNLALHRFWEQFGMTVYADGFVPHDAILPYIVFDVADNATFGNALLSATAWMRIGPDNAPLAALLDEVQKRIPAQGVRLPVTGGLLMLYPGTGTFTSYRSDDTDAAVKGAHVLYEINYYKI